MTTHQQYKESSPYYRSILATEGRYLKPEVVRSILKDHGFTEAEYTADVGAPIPLPALPEETDAADLLEWLGY